MSRPVSGCLVMRAIVTACLACLISAGWLMPSPARALDNGLRVPPMGWSSWYGFTSHVNETMLRAMGDGMVSSGLHAAGYDHIWLDDGWAIARDNATGVIVADPVLFPSGMANLTSYLHNLGLKFGIYTSKGPLTCLGYQKTQPNRPGSCGYEAIDAKTYVEWGIDAVKDDGCGQCPQHDPWVAMADALNATGKAVWLAIHPAQQASAEYPTVANMWRTGGDLSASSFDMWTNRLDLATAPAQAALAGPGHLPNPDFLEVGYSPRAPKGSPNVQSALEQRSMFTMWAALPGPLMLSADLRPNAASGGIDSDSKETLTNTEVIAVNQDELVAPMRLVSNSSGLQVWAKDMAAPQHMAVVFFHRGLSTVGPIPNPPSVAEISVSFDKLGIKAGSNIAVRDLWAHTSLGNFQSQFAANVTQRDAKIFLLQVL